MPTVRIDDKRWREAEKKAVELTLKIQKPIAVSEVIKAAIDKALKDLKPEDLEK